MKPICPFSFLLALSLAFGAAFLMSCTVVRHPTAGTFASIGGDTTDFKATTDGISFSSNANSAAFSKTLDTGKSISTTAAAKSLVLRVIDETVK